MMGSRIINEEHTLTALLHSHDEHTCNGSDIEIEHHDIDDDVSSNGEEAFVDEEIPEDPPAGGNQMYSLTTCNRKTARWSMALFYGMINIACINAYIIYNYNVNQEKKALS